MIPELDYDDFQRWLSDTVNPYRKEMGLPPVIGQEAERCFEIMNLFLIKFRNKR